MNDFVVYVRVLWPCKQSNESVFLFPSVHFPFSYSPVFLSKIAQYLWFALLLCTSLFHLGHLNLKKVPVFEKKSKLVAIMIC